MEDEPSGIATIREALAELPLFRGCSAKSLEECGRRARSEFLAGGCEIMPPEHVIFVVLSGKAMCRAGVGPLSWLETGSTLNAASLLTGARADPAQPVLTRDPIRALVDGMESTCITNLCPHTPVKETTPRPMSRTASRPMSGSSRRPQSGTTKRRGQLTVTGAPRGSVKRIPLLHGGPPPTPMDAGERGGATLAALSLETLEECLSIDSSLKTFHANRDSLLERWSVIVRSTLLPGASNEILFAVTEVADRVSFDADQLIFKEGDMDTAIFIVEEGEATVEKRVVSRTGKTVDTVTVGTISRGAVIGDATLLCAKVSRCATVRAMTSMTIIKIPPAGFLTVLRRFPGTVTCIEERIKETVGLLAEALPPKMEVLASVKLFATSDQMFLQAVSANAERHVFYCGDVLKREGTKDGTLYVVEFGACSVEVAGKGVLAELSVGSCMGERTLLGAEKANATVRVATPLAMMLTVPQSAFNNTLRRFPWDGQRFEKLRDMPGGARGHDASGLKIFQGSSPEFVREISAAMAIRCFLPGQTVIVQGTADAGQMFAIKGGRVSIEVDGRPVHKLGVGDVFGELAMVGVVRRRTSTVRAMTFCIMLEIPREAFLASIDGHPRERQRFEAFATQHVVSATSLQWPILRDMPSQMVYMVNLFAERRICIEGDTSLSNPAVRDAAIMVMQGSLRIVNADGTDSPNKVVEGECFNEQALLGHPSGQHLRPIHGEACEVQILTKEVWEKVLAEFSERASEAKRKILQEMAGKAEERLEGCRGGLGVLRRSAVFRSVSNEMAEEALKGLEEHIYQNGEVITQEYSKNDNMFWVLIGAVHVTDTKSVSAAWKVAATGTGGAKSNTTDQSWKAEPGSVLSESVVTGTNELQPYTLRSVGVTLVQTFSRRQLNNMLQTFHVDRWAFTAVHEEARTADHSLSLQDRILTTKFFSATFPRDVAEALCERVEDAFFAPSEAIFTVGETCEFGSSCMYVLLAGQALVESQIGIAMGRVAPGDVLGEAGAFGFAERRGATVRCWNEGLVHCARLQGHIVKEVSQCHPDATTAIRELFRQRDSENRAFQENKQLWLMEVVAPALMCSPILAGLSKAVIDDIAAQSAGMVTYGENKNITEAGQPANSMLLLLEGSVDVLTKSGQVVGSATPGAMFGEVCLFGLLMLRTATVCTRTVSKVITVTADTVATVLAKPSSAASRAVFERTRQARLEQVSRGAPVAFLPSINFPKDSVVLRTLSLQAERIHLPAGSNWVPKPDSSPLGPSFGFLLKGHATLQNPEEGRPIMALPERCVMFEGLVAKYGALILAVTSCEAYRLSQVDFELAVRLGSDVAVLYDTFQMLLKESRRHMSSRLQSARGALDGSLPRKKDTEIRLWRLERQMSMDHAGRTKSFKSQADSRQKQRRDLLRTTSLQGAGGACLQRSSSATTASTGSGAQLPRMSAVLSRYPETGIFLKTLPAIHRSTSSPRLRDLDDLSPWSGSEDHGATWHPSDHNITWVTPTTPATRTSTRRSPSSAGARMPPTSPGGAGLGRALRTPPVDPL